MLLVHTGQLRRQQLEPGRSGSFKLIVPQPPSPKIFDLMMNDLGPAMIGSEPI